MQLINFWQILIGKFMNLSVIDRIINRLGLAESLKEAGLLPVYVYHPHWVEIILLFDSILITFSLLVIVLWFLNLCVILNHDDLSPVPIPKEDILKSIRLINLSLSIVRILAALSALQWLMGEPLLWIVSTVALFTLALIWLGLKCSLLENGRYLIKIPPC